MQLSEADRQPYPPGDLAMWIFILAELAVFGIFFCAYAYSRMSHAEWPARISGDGWLAKGSTSLWRAFRRRK